MNDNVRVVVELLKDAGDGMKLNEIVQKTKDSVAWRSNTTYDMTKIMQEDNRIIKANKGIYKYVEPKPLFQEPKPQPEPPRLPKLRNGQIVRAVVQRIVNYGVFVNVPDHGITGLIHVSNIKRGVHFFRYEDIARYFEVGDEIDCKFSMMDRHGKFSFTTYDLPLPNKKREDADWSEKLASIAAELKPKPLEPPAVPATTTTYRGDTMEKKTGIDEMEQLYEAIRKQVGVISLNGKDALKEAVKKHGVVRVTMALMRSEDFEADVSLAFVRHLEAKVNGGL